MKRSTDDKFHELTRLISREIEDENDLIEIMNAFAEASAKRLLCELCTIWVADEKEERLILKGTSASNKAEIGLKSFSRGDGVIWYVYASEKPVRMNPSLNDQRVRTDTEYTDKYAGTKPYIALPIVFAGSGFGCVYFENSSRYLKFTDENVETAQEIGRLLGKKLHETSTKLKEIQLRSRKKLFLAELKEKLDGCKTVDEVYTLSAHKTNEFLKCRSTAIFTFSKNGNLERKSIAGLGRVPRKPECHYLGEGIIGKTISKSKVGTIRNCYDYQDELKNLENETLKRYATNYKRQVKRAFEIKEKLTHVLSVPIQGLTRPFAVLAVSNKLSPETGYLAEHAFGSEDEEVLVQIAKQIASTVANLKRQLKSNTIFQMNVLSKESEKEFLREITRILAGENTSYAACFIHRIEENGRQLRVVSSAGEFKPLDGPEGLYVDIDQGTAGRAFASGKPEIVSNIPRDPEHLQSTPSRRHSARQFA